MYQAKLKQYGGDLTPRTKNGEKVKVVVETGEETKVQQHFKDQCDINKIVNNLDASSSAAHVKQARERFGDFSDMIDLAGNMQKAVDARQAFLSLPVELRKRIDHDPDRLFAFIVDANNKEECYKYGIFDRPKEEVIPRVEVTNFAPQATKGGGLKKPKVQSDSSDTEA